MATSTFVDGGGRIGAVAGGISFFSGPCSDAVVGCSGVVTGGVTFLGGPLILSRCDFGLRCSSGGILENRTVYHIRARSDSAGSRAPGNRLITLWFRLLRSSIVGHGLPSVLLVPSRC